MFSPHGFVLSLPKGIEFDDDQLFEFCIANPELRIERDEHQQIIIMSPNGSLSGKRHTILLWRLVTWNEEHGLGSVFDSSAGFRLPDGSMRAADVAWVSNARWHALSKEQKEKFAPVCPEFVVEFKSPSDSWEELKQKMPKWIKNGAQLGWLIDVDAGKVLIYGPEGMSEHSSMSNPITGGEVLPGFQFDLSSLSDL